MELKNLARLYRVAKGEEKIERAWNLAREAARYSNHEPYWDFLKNAFGVKAKDVKDALLLLEESGKLQIKRSIDGRRLYVSTLKDIRENPVKLDRWLALKKPPGK